MAAAAQTCQCCATETNSCGLRQRRRSAHSLSLLEMPDTSSSDMPGLVDRAHRYDDLNVEAEGRELFGNFLREEINRERLPNVDLEQVIMDTPIHNSSPSSQQHNPIWVTAGRELREMADAFSKTKERQQVRDRANAVGNNITFEQFQDLLTELFVGGGITKERIMILFIFCSDLAIRMLKRKAIDYFKQFIEWSFRYITERVCQWVKENGGWGAVLSNGMQVATKIGIMVFLGVCSIAMFQWMNRRIS